jgi:ATP-dependent Lhr-like helicase
VPLHPVVVHHVVNTLQWPALRPLQQEAVEPIRGGEDALLLAPTAGGKTEAAVFPLLSEMASNDWRGMSLLYVCPLRALLNNLEPRLSAYCGWLGRRAAVWHGDVVASRRRQLVSDPADLLLTTPESLEAMLVSTTLAPRELFAGLRAVVIDEVHSFAGDDRGWHLLAVLERLSKLAGRPLQRIALSATVGNPAELLAWLQGSNRGSRAARVISPEATAEPFDTDVQLDFVGSIDNAATVIAALHKGEKRLAFAESRRKVESLALALRERGVNTFVSHSSLSYDERRRAEQAFAEARDCVIVSTSTLELGIDVGDLDRIVQVGSPRRVASFLQRLGRTGRRPGAHRNALFLATTDEELLQSAGLLLLWGEGYVEPISPPPSPRHLQAQQLLALCLQERRIGDKTWTNWLDGLELASAADTDRVIDWLVETGHLDHDQGMLFVGPAAERAYGHRHFLDLISVFLIAPEFAVLHGSVHIGTVDPMVLFRRVEGPRVLALAGRSWTVRHVDWQRPQIWVEESDVQGSSRWMGEPQPWSYALTDAARRVLLGMDPAEVRLTRRAAARMQEVRETSAFLVDPDRTVVTIGPGGAARWWTWAGSRANVLLSASLAAVAPEAVDDRGRYDNRFISLADGCQPDDVSEAIRQCAATFRDRLSDVTVDIDDNALRALKFADLLPHDLAVRTLAARMLDPDTAAIVASRPLVVRRSANHG